jgi:hypothetical protein
MESDLQKSLKKYQKSQNNKNLIFFTQIRPNQNFKKKQNMIFVHNILMSIDRINQKKWLRKKDNLEKKLGPKYPKNPLFSKNLKILKSKKSELYKRHNWTQIPLCSEKK